ncbi:MAG: FGGY family carbohydrate kinase, partial [Phycisphaerales bacterium]|nr:FGGY family carbohydrate kinase [Phycisphaerales bacterium]
MSSPPLVLGIDIGTGGVRILLVDALSGRVADRADDAWPTETPHPLWSEQNPELWWTTTAAAIRRIVDRGDEIRTSVRGGHPQPLLRGKVLGL